MQTYTQQPMPSQYDFITSQSAPSKGGFFAGQSTRARILIFSAIIAVVLILASIIGAIIAGSGNKSAQNVISVVQQQNEIARIAAIGVSKARSSTAQNLAISTQLSMQSDQALVLARIKASGTKVNDKTLSATKATSTDAALNQASQNNAFDETFTKTMQTQLAAYRRSVKKAYDETQGNKTKQVLSDCYTHAGTLLSSIPETTN